MNNSFKNNLLKIQGLLFYFQSMAKTTDDPVCTSFLQSCIEKKKLQLVALKNAARSNGIEIVISEDSATPLREEPTGSLKKISLEGIFNLTSNNSIATMKNAMFLSALNCNYRPVFQLLFRLEEEFLSFVQEEYLRLLVRGGEKTRIYSYPSNRRKSPDMQNSKTQEAYMI